MKTARTHATRNRLLMLLLAALALYVILPRFGSFKSSLDALRQVDTGYASLAVILTFLTFAFAALTYQLLAFSALRYPRTLMVAVASMFTNRLLPAGTGGMATYFLYLKRHKHSPAQAGSVVAVNNTLGWLGHNILLLAVLLLLPSAFSGLALPKLSETIQLTALSIAVALVALLIFKSSWRKKIRTSLQGVGKNILAYRKRPLRLSAALGSSIGLTLCNVASLWLSVLAVHATISPIAALAVFTIGIAASTATPTPGGLGGAEAGFLAGLVAYHVPAAPALAAVLLYRLISYWLTLITGFLAFLYCEQRKII